MEKSQVNALIQEKLDAANKALEEAANIARAHKTSFSWSGPTYGMGGWFDPENTEDYYGNETDGWLASSNSC